MDEEGITRGVSGVAADAARRMTAPSPGPVRAPRRPAPAAAGSDGSARSGAAR